MVSTVVRLGIRSRRGDVKSRRTAGAGAATGCSPTAGAGAAAGGAPTDGEEGAAADFFFGRRRRLRAFLLKGGYGVSFGMRM